MRTHTLPSWLIAATALFWIEGHAPALDGLPVTQKPSVVRKAKAPVQPTPLPVKVASVPASRSVPLAKPAPRAVAAHTREITSPLTLRDCVDIALQHNFGFAIRRIEEASAFDEVDVALGVFEPEFFGAAGRRFSGGTTSVTDFDVSGYRSGVVTNTPSGATVALTSELNQSEFALQPDRFDSDLGLTLRQPLLRGGGFHYNLIPVKLARIEVNQADAEVRHTLLDLMQSVEMAWWELAFAHRSLALAEKTFAVNERLLAEAQARVKVGLAAELEVLQANTAIASRREDIITARQRIEDRMDDLLLHLGKLGVADYSVALPGNLPSIVARKFTTAEALALVRALPEYRIQRDNLQTRKLLVDRARNETLPTLDVTAGGGFNGSSFTGGDAFERGFDKSRPDWQLLGEVRIPLGFRSERANLRKAKNALQIEDLRLASIEQVLHSQIREAERAVATGIERIKVTEASLGLSEQQFEQLLAKFKEGLNTFREMQLAEEDVQDARVRALASQLEAVLASVRLARLDGTLLSRYGLSWGEGQ
jgi:outer membrane protein